MRLSKKPAKTTPAPPTGGVRSQLLSDALRCLAEDPASDQQSTRISVLDLGPGNAGTVNFLSQFNAKIVFLDILDCAELINAPEDLSLADAIRLCQQHIQLPADTRFDVLLLWDYLHHMNLTVLEGLSATLQNSLHRSTMGYGFGALHSNQTLDHLQYGLTAMDRLTQREANPPGTFTPHPQQRLSEHFLCMRIAKSTLLQGGRLEMLFEAR